MTVREENSILVDEDRRLVQRCLEGQEEAFEELVERYQNMVYNLAYRFMGEPQEAEDLSQEVFLKVYRSLKGFRSDSTLKTWIYRITTNMALNRLKWFKRRRNDRQVSIDHERGASLPKMADTLSDSRPGPEHHVHATEIQQRLQDALDSISPDQKAVVILRDIEHFSYEEIAETLSINIGTVKSRLARGRSSIQELLKDLM